LAGTLVLAALGCDYGGMSRLHAPPQGYSGEPNLVAQEPYAVMVDNAMMSDMIISDIHFVPHTNELNGLGAHRLERYARLLKHYGGTLRYDSTLDNEKMIEKRMEHVSEFLATAGLETDDVKVVRGIAGGEGLPATEAVMAVKGARTPVQHARPAYSSGGGEGGGGGSAEGGS